MRNALWIVALVCVALLGTSPVTAGEGVEAGAVFDQLKGLEGTWHGVPKGEGVTAEAEEAPHGEVTHVFQVSAAGNVVMETMRPGTDHEMINMYHLDGEELMMTHYCAGGNQPRMRLNRAKSSADKLIFDFVDGTNLDPAVDGHIHAGELVFHEGGTLESVWVGYNEGKPAGKMTFHLARGE